MRIYDARLGKFLSVDPITKQYPELTPYQFASNRPIDGIDLDGLEYMNAKKSIYSLNKFQVAKKYTQGALEIRNLEVHSIVMGHPLNADRPPSTEDDSVPEVQMVKQRSSSNDTSFTYLYDMGDYWQHKIVVEEIQDKVIEYPVCL